MSQASTTELSPQSKIKLVKSGHLGTVVDTLGAGGQGIVYVVQINGSRYALKWYHKQYIEVDKRLRERISRAIERGPPDLRFLWPMDLVEAENKKAFGYLMPIRRSAFRSFRDLLAAPPQRIDLSLSKRLVGCLRIAESFFQLHAKGFCYQDINLNNIFIDPDDGNICICDNDNVDVDGVAGAIYGTRKFMAPEVVLRTAFPSTNTDLYSMSVLFFYMLHSWHPLDGKRESEIMLLDAEAETDLYAANPLFMFDPGNAENGPVRGLHDSIELRWRSLSKTVRALFTRAFAAKAHPASRVVETEWIRAFAQMHDSLVTCDACGYEQAFDPRDDAHACVHCTRSLGKPERLVIGRDAITLVPNQKVFKHHVVKDSAPDYAEPQATVERHPTMPDVLGLKNLSDVTWAAALPDGRRSEVPPQRSIRIVEGLTIEFGHRSGVIAK